MRWPIAPAAPARKMRWGIIPLLDKTFGCPHAARTRVMILDPKEHGAAMPHPIERGEHKLSKVCRHADSSSSCLPRNIGEVNGCMQWIATLQEIANRNQRCATSERPPLFAHFDGGCSHHSLWAKPIRW